MRVLLAAWAHSQAKGARLLTLLAVAEAADGETWQAYPGLTHLARAARTKPRQALAHLQALIEAGELERVQPGHRGQRAEYRVLVGKGEARDTLSSVDRVQRRTHFSGERMHSRAIKGALPRKKRVHRTTALPNTEPTTEPKEAGTAKPSPVSPNGSHEEEQSHSSHRDPQRFPVPYADVYERVMQSPMQFGRAGTALKGVEEFVVRSGEAPDREAARTLVLPVWRHYWEHAKAASKKPNAKPQLWNPQDFERRFGLLREQLAADDAPAFRDYPREMRHDELMPWEMGP